MAALVQVTVHGAVAVAPAIKLRGPQGWSIELPLDAPAAWLADLLRHLYTTAGRLNLAVHCAGRYPRRHRPPVLRVQQALGRRMCNGTTFVFSNRREARLEVAHWHGNGVWMCVRRLHRGQLAAHAQAVVTTRGGCGLRLSAPAPAAGEL